MTEDESNHKAVAKFRKRRRFSQVTVIFGLVLLFTAIFLKSFLTLQFVFLFSGFLLVVLGLYFYQSIFGSCPSCRKRFLFYKDYEEGLPVFSLIRECPFCGIKL